MYLYIKFTNVTKILTCLQCNGDITNGTHSEYKIVPENAFIALLGGLVGT